MSNPDYHAIGLMSDVEEREDEVGAIINTPGSILAEMDTVKGMVETLNTAIQNQLRADDASVRPVFLQEWTRFRDEFLAFYGANTSWTSRLWGAAIEKTDDYKMRVIQWQDAFKKEGVALTGPEFKAPEAFPWKWVIAGGIVIGAAIVVKEAAGIVRSFKGGSEDG